MDRRQFLGGLGAVAVVGFSSSARAWVTCPTVPDFQAIPALDGELVTDPASIAAVSTDAGNIVHKTPIAVLRPGSVRDVQAMVRFCARSGIRVAARGQGHTTFGQSLVEGGLIIEMSTLNTIHSVTPTSADVDAGLKWKDLLLAVVPQGLTPPVLTGFTGLSIGGTLSVGGISSTNGSGAQVDNVRALQVVTGRGDLVWCSALQNRELFEVALGGLGQCAIIVRAIVDLVPAKAMVRTYSLTYTSNSAFFRDFRELLRRGELNDVQNLWFPNPAGGWLYQLSAAAFYDPATPPDDSQLLRGLSVDPTSAQTADIPYLNYVLRVDVLVDQLRQLGLWDNVLHPWFDVFLPDATIERYVGEVVPTLQPDDVGVAGLMLLFPQRRSRFTRRFLRVPRQNEWFYLFDILTSANTPGPNPDFESRMMTRNRTLFEKARRYGGTRYPIGSLDFSRLDWAIQYGETYPELVLLKQRFDPAGILTPGPGIFR